MDTTEQHEQDASGIQEEEAEIVSFTSLHELYRQCHKPLEIYKQTVSYLKSGVPVNHVDETGSTAISLLILHVNRGLRYHQYRLPQLAKLEDANAKSTDMAKMCVEVDREYQEQVHKCLVEVLEKGADCNIIPMTCPGIPYDAEWSENYEHKIMQTDQRWNLFSFGGSMEFTTYSIFNPLSRHRPSNSKGVTVLHLAAWRGDAKTLQLLVDHGADVHAKTSDNRNALHFLYLYCNKPDDLIRCTELLIRQGIDVNMVDANGHSPLLVLLSHFLVKQSHIKYLSNCYTDENIAAVTCQDDHFKGVVRKGIELLVEAGACVGNLNHNLETPLHHMYSRFEHSVRNCEPDFQVKGHYLVPYNFQVLPLIEFSRFLIGLGCQVNARDSLGRTPLLRLISALRNLSLDECLNSTDAVCECFRILLEEGAEVNTKDYHGKTSLHHLVDIACSTKNALDRYYVIMRCLVAHGALTNTRDNNGNGILHFVLKSSMRAEHMQALLVFLLQCGADPNATNIDNKYPLNNLMRQHIHHHDPLCLGGVALRLDHYLRTIDIVCKVMSPVTLGYVFSVYRESGFWGVICEEECSVYQLLKEHYCNVRSLKELCRLTIWQQMGSRFWSRCSELPLPKEIIAYVHDLVY